MRNNLPPKWMLTLYQLCCPSDEQDELLGDSIENFQWRLDKNKHWSASWLFFLDILGVLRLFAIQKLYINITPMIIQNYLKIYVRSIKKYYGQFAITVCGLILGISSFLSVFTYVKYEQSYDQHIPSPTKTYRITKLEKNRSHGGSANGTSYLLKDKVLNEISGVSKASRLVNGRWNHAGFNYPKDVAWQKFTYHSVDTDFFDTFGLEWITGNKEHAFDVPHSIVITEKIAETVFKDIDPMGETVWLNGMSMEVTGVIQNIPLNTHFQADYFININNIFKSDRWDKDKLKTDWTYANFIFNYITLEDANSKEKVTDQINELYKSHVSNGEDNVTLDLFPVTDIHLMSHSDWELAENGNPKFLEILMIIAVTLLTLTMINFTNVSAARLTSKGKEIGIRKINGSSKSQVLFMFLFENMLTLLLAATISVLIASAAMNILRDQFDLTFNLAVLLDWKLLGLLFGSLTLVGLLASIYPAWLQARFKAIDSIKGQILGKEKGMGLLQWLVMLQVIVCFFLVSVSLLFQDQISFLLNKDLGFEKNNLMYIQHHIMDMDKSRDFTAALNQHSGIKSSTGTNQLPLHWPAGANYELVKVGESDGVSMSRGFIGYNYFKTLGVKIQEGREFSPDIKSDTAGIIINEAARMAMGWKEPIGQKVKITFRGGRVTNHMTVIGVVNDFNYRTLHDDLKPSYFVLAGVTGVTTLNIESSKFDDILPHIEEKFSEFAPNQYLDWHMMKDRFTDQHKTDIHLKDALQYLSIVVIGLACLGLFGISSYASQARMKEISLRKVFGANFSQLLWILEKRYIIISFFAAIICTIPVMLVFQSWLENYAYQTHLDLWRLIQTLVIILLVIITVTGFHTLKTILINPTDLLRDE